MANDIVTSKQDSHHNFLLIIHWKALHTGKHVTINVSQYSNETSVQFALRPMLLTASCNCTQPRLLIMFLKHLRLYNTQPVSGEHVLTFLIVRRISAFFARMWEVTGSFSNMDIATKQLSMSCTQNNYAADTTEVKDEYKIFEK